MYIKPLKRRISTRTTYRIKRRQMLKSIIMNLIDLYGFSDNKLEKIPLALLTIIKKRTKDCYIEANPYERDMIE